MLLDTVTSELLTIGNVDEVKSACNYQNVAAIFSWPQWLFAVVVIARVLPAYLIIR